MKLLKELTTKNTIKSTERNIITELLKLARSVCPKKVAAYTPTKGVRIPSKPKKNVSAACTLGFKKTPNIEK